MIKYLIFLLMLTSTITSAETIIIQIPHNNEDALADGIAVANNNPNDEYINLAR